MATKTPENLHLAAKVQAPIKFNDASDEGLSDDLWAPTNTIGTGRF